MFDKSKLIELAVKLYKKRAEKVSEDSKAALELADKAEEKLESKKSLLGEVREELKTFFRLLRSYYRGEYRDIDIKSIVLIIMALIYFIMPLDFIFDYIPVSGLIDDVAIVLWVLSKVDSEVKKYREWESQC